MTKKNIRIVTKFISFILMFFISFHLYPTSSISGSSIPASSAIGAANFSSTESVSLSKTLAEPPELTPVSRADIHLIPGGQSIGVQLETLGVLVVGHHAVEGGKGQLSPGHEAKVLVGDMIVEINGNTIAEMKDIKNYVSEAGEKQEPLQLKLKRGKETIQTSLQPILDVRDKQYKIGLYIRDSAAGIGTMTFYDQETKRYGALGHVISDMDTKKPIEMMKGTIVRSSVVNIEKGNEGIPGEKHARFSANRNILGNIIKNTPHGIFGVLESDIQNGKYDKPLPITRSTDVKVGPAKILTVVDNEAVQEFDIEIVSSVPQKEPDIKGMVIKVTDPELLERTGGIVQGMSGSPIIQDGKLVGAVTHVFVNDPTSGYGVHIEWMLNDAEIHVEENQQIAA